MTCKKRLWLEAEREKDTLQRLALTYGAMDTHINEENKLWLVITMKNTHFFRVSFMNMLNIRN